MIIRNNIPAINTLRNNGINGGNTAKALERLSSGLKINRAGDDAAGLAISEKMRAQVGGLNRASLNSQDGISLVQSADAALSEVHSILHRMRELSIQAANDVNQAVDRMAIQNEIDQLISEVDRISMTTEFNGMTILDGSLNSGKYIKTVSGSNITGLSLLNAHDADGRSTLVNGLTSISVEAGAQFSANFDFSLPHMNEPYVMGGVVQVSSVLQIALSDDIALTAGLATPAFYAIAVNAGDTAPIIAGNVRAALAEALAPDWTVIASGPRVSVVHNFAGEFSEGISIEADPSPWDPGMWTTSPFSENVTGTEGRDVVIRVDGEIADLSLTNTHSWANVPEDGSLRGRDTLLNLRIGTGDDEGHRYQFLFRLIDPTISSGAIVSTRDGSDLTLQVGANTGYAQTVRVGIVQLSTAALGISELSMLSHADAQNAISAIDGATQIVSDQRAVLGAIQNRLDHTIANLDTVAENLAEAESRLRDADMAKEMMEFTKHSILLQSSQAMLAQAYNLPQGVLQLLR